MLETLRRTRAAGIRTKGLLMMAHPTESEDSLEETIAFLRTAPLDLVQITKFTPYPGTPSYATVREHGRFVEDWERMNAMHWVFVPHGLSPEILERAFRRAYGPRAGGVRRARVLTAAGPPASPRGDVAALVPAYDAAATVGAVVAGARLHCATVLVVDDGSADATAAVAAAAGAEVVRHAANRGKGAALGTGLRALAARGIARALTLDADGQHLPDEIPRLLAASDATPAAIVVGERRKTGHAIKRANRFGNWLSDRLLRALAGRRLPDTQSGFRVYPVAATLALGTRGLRYDFETEVLLLAARVGMPLVGVPVRVHYPPIAERVSHFRPWRDTLRIIATVVRVLVAAPGR
jgi:hypothetical protein